MCRKEDQVMSRFLHLLFVSWILACAAFGQSAALQGIVTDSQGSVVANAKVTATDEAKALIARTTTTGPDGAFELSPLQPGAYAVKIEAKGFKTSERRGIALDLSQTLSLGKIALEVGAVTES